LMLQKDEPDDYVISSERQYSIRHFCNLTAEYFGFKLQWLGDGLNEHAVDRETEKLMIVVDPLFYRPVDVVNLIGDSTKAHKELKWNPKFNINQLVSEMCSYDFIEKEKEYV